MKLLKIDTNDTNINFECELTNSGMNKLFINLVESSLDNYFISIEKFDKHRSLIGCHPYTLFVPTKVYLISKVVAYSDNMAYCNKAALHVKIFDIDGRLVSNDKLKTNPIYLEYDEKFNLLK